MLHWGVFLKRLPCEASVDRESKQNYTGQMPAESVTNFELGAVRNVKASRAYCGTKAEDTKRTHLQDRSTATQHRKPANDL